MRRHLLALLVCSLASPSGGSAGGGQTRWLADPSQADRIRRVEQGLPAVSLPGGQPLAMDLEQWMQFFRIPGLSIAVFDDFHIVWMKGYGVRDAGTSDPVTLETTFQAGSISKPVTALAVMRFVQEGKFSLDQNINDLLLSWKLPDNEFTAREKVTLRRLLSHSAGTTVHGFPGYAVGEPVPTTVQVLNGEKPANTAPVRVVMVPGTKYEYSGGGTTIVQLMLVDQLKQPFPQIMAETVIGPLGLKHSSYEQPQPPARAALAATGHRPNGKPVEGKWHVYPEMAAAGLWTTAGDLAEVAIEVAKSKHGKANRILSPATVQQMLTVQAVPVGLGFFLDPKSDRFGHDGSDEGFLAALIAFSDSGKGVAIMTNSDSGFMIFGPLTASIAKEYGWASYTPEPTSPFVRFSIVSRRLGVKQAIEDYASMRARGPAKDFRSADLNACGYALLTNGQTEEAVQVFQANATLYPDDANAYDSLGEAYMVAGKRDLAIENYEKSLKMNPRNDNAVRMLAKLGVHLGPDAGSR
jgi:CubicO group peptidase (beta-lactamase class C family)